MTGSLFLAEGSKVRAGVHELRGLAPEGDRGLRHDRRAAWRRHDARDARLHVLGGRAAVVPGVATQPPNACENRMGADTTAVATPVPMPVLRQQ
jgi:hypothetical protein